MRLEDRKMALLRLVDEYRDKECRQILDAARAEAAERVARAYRKERAHLHERVVSERGRADVRIQAARAERATRERRSSERAHTELLETAWPHLRARLLARWLESAGRRAWTRRYLLQALELLPQGPWHLRHAAHWSEPERREATRDLDSGLAVPPEFEIDDSMQAGLIVECEGAVLDASLDGLMRDRARLEARLLALLEMEDRA